MIQYIDWSVIPEIPHFRFAHTTTKRSRGSQEVEIPNKRTPDNQNTFLYQTYINL